MRRAIVLAVGLAAGLVSSAAHAQEFKSTINRHWTQGDWAYALVTVESRSREPHNIEVECVFSDRKRQPVAVGSRIVGVLVHGQKRTLEVFAQLNGASFNETECNLYGRQ